MPADASASRLVRLGYPLLAAALFALYLPTLARGPTASDGPEIVAAVVALGVIHPTGYPVFTILAHGFTRVLPAWIAPCVKVEIFNALAGAGAALFTALAARGLARGRLGASARDADLAGLVAGLVLGTSPLLWEEVRIPEVYAFHLFLVAWAGHALCRFEVTGRDAWLLGAAVPMGLGLAHHVTMVYLVAAALLSLAVRPRPRFASSRALPLAVLTGALPLLSYGYLPWADAHTLGVAWGSPGEWDTLYRHVTAQQYQAHVASAGLAAALQRVAAFPALLGAQLLPAGALLAVAGMVALFRQAWRPAAWLLVFLVLNLAHGVLYAVPDHASYDVPALFPLAVFAGLGLAWAVQGARRRGRVAAIAVGAGSFASFLAVLPLRAFSVGRGTVVTEAYGAELVERIPPGSVYLTLGDGFVFTLWYEDLALGRGTGIATVDTGNLWTWWYERYLRRRYPWVSLDLTDPRAAGRHPIEVFTQRILEDNLDDRPVFERNVITHWGRPQGREGPTFQRPPSAYALVNRGQYNQIVHVEDVAGLDPCAGDTLRPIALHPRPRGPDHRRAYQPSAFPTLLASTYLAASIGAGAEGATRSFAPGEPVFLHLGWFERYRSDGAPIHHGVRVCVFDPSGRKVVTYGALSGGTSAVQLLPITPETTSGIYTVAACSLGDVSDAAATLERRCDRAVLEYSFTVR